MKTESIENLAYWENIYRRKKDTIHRDGWLEKHSRLIQGIERNRVLDLGCGWGNNVQYLASLGVYLIACDFSRNALSHIRRHFPQVRTEHFDFLDGLPFPDESMEIIIADLSLHYFFQEQTRRLLADLSRVLVENGCILARVNSTREIWNKGQVRTTVERHVFENEGIIRRFFDRSDIDHFFSSNVWDVQHCEEYEVERYGQGKWLWEIAARKSRHGE